MVPMALFYPHKKTREVVAAEPQATQLGSQAGHELG